MKLNRRPLQLLFFSLFPLIALSYFITHGPSPDLPTETIVSDDDTIHREVFPALMVKNEKGESKPIQLHTLKIDVKVVGNVATTTMDMTFYNDEKRILEGELYFPLGEGQTVSRFALEVDGKLREGVVVEKEKGRQVFESTVRRNIDPGLLEWTQGNNFKARVYPIPSKGYKHMVIAYEQELDMMEQSYMYLLPMNFRESIPDFAFNIEVLKQEVEPKLDPNSIVNFEFEKWEENYRANYAKKDFVPGSFIAIGLPWPKNKQAIYTERVPGTDNDFYFYTTLTPRRGKAELKQPGTVTLIWDASNSGKQRKLAQELALLEAYFQSLQNVDVELITLRNTTKVVRTFSIQGGDCSELKKQLESIPFDGASAYRSIDFSKFGSDAIVLVGDGLNNFGVNEDAPPKVPVYTINSASSANHSYLRFLASSSGGAYINLLKTEHRGALEMLRGGNFRYFGNGMADTYPSLPTTMGEQIHVAGIIHGKTEMDFKFGFDEANSQIHMTIEPEKYLIESGTLRRIWAQKKLAELDIYPEENAETITTLGKEYGLVTRNTSLIVLDRVEDYVQHEITPPDELKAEYMALLQEKQQTEKAEKEAHITKVKEDFKAYADWWITNYDIQKITENNHVNDSIIEIGSEPISNAVYYSTNADEVTSDLEVQTEELNGRAAFSASDGSYDQNLTQVSGKKDGGEEDKAAIQLSEWEPDAEYLKTLKKVVPGELYKTYLELKKDHGQTPSFYMDVSDLFIEKGMKDQALRILSNIAELELENHELLRILAHRLEQLGYYNEAIVIYREVLRIRGEEPQSYRDLGLCLEKAGKYQEAVDQLFQVVDRTWDSRFPGIESIALVEINRIVSLHKGAVNTGKIDPELLKDMPLDVRIILNWDTDNCDMDLWVTDPRGEKCFYSNKNTRIGGRMSNDFTGGYGPEMFTIKKAIKGEYVVQVNYYGSRSQKAAGPTTIQMQLVTNYGRPNEKVQEITRRLSTNKEVLDIGKLLFE